MTQFSTAIVRGCQPRNWVNSVKYILIFILSKILSIVQKKNLLSKRQDFGNRRPATVWGVFEYRASARAHALQPLGPPRGQPRPRGPKTAGKILTGNPYKVDFENLYRKSPIKI